MPSIKYWCAVDIIDRTEVHDRVSKADLPDLVSDPSGTSRFTRYGPISFRASLHIGLCRKQLRKC
jgi:hypothetical protein